MIIYRFEKNGIGPYIKGVANGSSFFKVIETKTYKVYSRKFDQLVHSIDETRRYEAWYKAHGDKSYMYGCKSKENLKAYFRGQFKPLFKEGFRIKRYKVPDEEVLDMGVEVAFPVKYHKLQSLKKLKKISP